MNTAYVLLLLSLCFFAMQDGLERRMLRSKRHYQYQLAITLASAVIFLPLLLAFGIGINYIIFDTGQVIATNPARSTMSIMALLVSGFTVIRGIRIEFAR